MNRKEIMNLLALATANFPSMQERDLKPTAVLWEKSLSDIPYNVAEKAIIKVLSTSKFFPTLAEIREAASQLTTPRTLDAIEAWGLVVQAIRRYGFYQEAKAMESLPPDVAEMVKRFTWRELCLNEEPDILRAQFRMAWETQSKRKKEMSALPTQLREVIEGLSSGMKMLEN
ncbi:replicative helicase loader/inhibitor [Bacillus sp. FJAT-45350]|uniref:replicative helicase loader/inhibitor n=1 Tax=Bacillus sp. FJAT-45350 TaxID=2011014 RepID=UPI000BB87D5C|nr:replicative helicase loader/inhibitor [Bacillus sp. FJAT-45350]